MKVGVIGHHAAHAYAQMSVVAHGVVEEGGSFTYCAPG